MSIETGNRLAQLRKEKGLSQEELANRIGVSRQAISKWENGESSPDTDNLVALAKVYGVTIDELINGEEAKPEPEKVDAEVVEPHKDEEDDDNDDDDDDLEPAATDSPLKRARKYINSVGFLVALIAYLIVGFTWKGPTGVLGWASMWTLFLVPVIIASILGAIEARKPSHFQIAVLVVGVYCTTGIIGSAYGANLWHPYWVEFLLIPIYHVVCSLIERK